MTIPAFYRTDLNVRPNAMGYLYLAEFVASGVPAVYKRFVAIQETELTQEADDNPVPDDSGNVYAFTSTVTSVSKNFTILARDAVVRKMFQIENAGSVLNKKYILVYLGAELASTADLSVPDTREILAASVVRFSGSNTYNIGGDGMMTGVKIEFLKNTGADYVVTMPSADADWPLASDAANLTHATGEYYVTTDSAEIA